MLTSIVTSVVKACTRFASVTVLTGLVLAIAAGFYTARHFTINTDINTLISSNLDWRKRDNQFGEAFDRDGRILAVVEAPTPELTNTATKALTQKLSADSQNFESVQPLGSGEFFEKHGLLFLPVEEVQRVTGQFESAAPLIEIMAGDPSIRGLTGALETALAGIQRGQLKLDSTERPFNLIAQSVERILNTGSGTFSWRELISDKPLSDTDRRGFIEFKPVLDYNALQPGRAATDAIRQAARDLNFAGEYAARVRLTGPIPIANEEYATVQDGALVNGLGTVVVVLIILWMALHSRKIIFAVFVNLFIGLSITTAVGLMMVGSLNLLSIAFAVLFVGLGVDFGIQYSVRYRSERFKSDDLRVALVQAAERSAVPLSLAAMATAAGFLSFLPTDYKGISELGAIAGAGMLVAFITSITVLLFASCLFAVIFFLPIYLQLGHHVSAQYAGLLLLPVTGGMVIAAVTSAKTLRRTGRPRPFGRRRRAAAALLSPVRFQSDQSAESARRIDRDLSGFEKGPQYRGQRHQCADELRRRGAKDQSAPGETAGSAPRHVAGDVCARGPAGKAGPDCARREGSRSGS